jgi:ribonuclease HII
MYIAGIDEAGRGPVIGPMVMAICACEDQTQLARTGAKDSKQLTAQDRVRIAAVLRENYPYELIVLSPQEIDVAVNGKSGGDSLNELEARTTALLIHRLAKRIPLSKVILDSPTRTVANYERAVRAALRRIDAEGMTTRIELIAQIKADANHPVVGAASVIAKTERDTHIERLTETHGRMGSGYPSDPDTQSFLHAHWREPHDFFRRSWESYKRLARADAAPAQATLADFGAKADEHAKVVKEFEALHAHGYAFVPPTNQYEVVRAKNAAGVTVIRYTTGKLVVQGPDAARTAAEALLRKLGLVAGPSSAVESKRPRGRPRKT